MKPLTIHQIAYHCVKGRPKTPQRKGHKAYQKHVLGKNVAGNRIKDSDSRNGFKRNEFKNLGIKTKKQYYDHITKTLNDPNTKAFKATNAGVTQ